MRVFLLSTQFPDYSLGLAAALAAEHEVFVAIDQNRLAEEFEGHPPALASGVVLGKFTQASALQRLVAVLRIVYFVARFRPNVVIAHEHAHPHISFVIRVASKFAPLVLIVHDPKPHNGRDSLFAAKNKTEILFQRRVAKRLVVHGEYCLSQLQSITGRDDIVSVPHGPILNPEICKLAGCNANILMFGRMEAYKGLDLLLQASQLAIDRGAKFQLKLLGRGPEISRLESAFVDLGNCQVENRYISRADLIEAMAWSDAIVAPYTEASQSGVVAAAFANGRAVIATRVGGLPDVIEHNYNGILVDGGSPERLAEALVAWSSDPARQGMLSRNARATSEQRAHWRVAAALISDACARAWNKDPLAG